MPSFIPTHHEFHTGPATAVTVLTDSRGYYTNNMITLTSWYLCREEEEEGGREGGRRAPPQCPPDLARDRATGPTDVMGEGLWKATRPTSSSGALHWREGKQVPMAIGNYPPCHSFCTGPL